MCITTNFWDANGLNNLGFFSITHQYSCCKLSLFKIIVHYIIYDYTYITYNYTLHNQSSYVV